MDKPFLSYEQQINVLKSKGLNIADEAAAVNALKEYSYFGLISGYKDLFKGSNGDYKLHTDFSDIICLYNFDNEMRNLFLKYILKIENHIKSLISYSFCEEKGDDENDYLNVTNYNYIPSNQGAINVLIGKLTDVCNEPAKYPYILHQKNEHNNIPLWVLTKALTFGVISKMYSLLPQNIQQKVSREFEEINESDLTQILGMVSKFRNVCAHNERLYDYKYKRKMLPQLPVHVQMNLVNTQRMQGRNDLFAVVIIFKYLLGKNDFDEFINALEKLIESLLNDTNKISRNQLYKKMGFPMNWTSIKEIEKASE